MHQVAREFQRVSLTCDEVLLIDGVCLSLGGVPLPPGVTN